MKQQENNFEYQPLINVGFWKKIIINLDINYWLKEIYNYYNYNSKSLKRSNLGGVYHSPPIQNHPPFFPLTEIINNSYLELVKDSNRVIQEMWINISPPHGYNGLHNHGSSDKIHSGVLYLKCPPNSGNINFYNIFNISTSYIHPPKEKEIIIFPNNLPHSVNPNLSQEDRISIAFNFN